MFDVKVTYLGRKYGVRVLKEGKPVVEVRVNTRMEIQPAIKDMLRTLSKLGYDCEMAEASRHRDNNMPTNKYKFIWL